MNRDGHKDVAFFIGPEVEQTPAFSKRTLFVVGKQEVSRILELANEQRTPHIFMGANHSFAINDTTDSYWDSTITKLLDKGFWVTLDYQAHEHEAVLKMLNPGIWQCRTFVPLLGVRIPKVQESSPNLTIKIDDVDFRATNPGVWCLHFHEITDSNRFTDWNEYATDVVLGENLNKEVTSTLSVPEPGVLGSNASSIDENTRESVENVVSMSDDKNDNSLGLDVDSVSLPKTNTDDASTPAVTQDVVDVSSVAKDYAEVSVDTKNTSKSTRSKK